MEHAVFGTEDKLPAAEQILAARLAGQTADPLLDAAIAQIGTRLN